MYKLFFIVLISNTCFAQLTNCWPHHAFFDSTNKHIPTAWSTFIHDYHIQETKVSFFNNPDYKMNFKQLVVYNFKKDVEFSENNIDNKLILDSISRNLIITKKRKSVYGYFTVNDQKQRNHLFINWQYDQLTDNARKIMKNKQIFVLNPFWQDYFFFDKNKLKVYRREIDMVIDASDFFRDSSVQALLKEWQYYLERKKNNPNEFWR